MIMPKCVGTNVPRLDGHDKVTGRTKYIDDRDIPGCWYGAVVRSMIPFGKIKSIAYDPAFDWKKVVVCTYKDIPGKNATIFLKDDQPILAEEFVRHVGEAVAVVAAPTKELAERARKAVLVDYEKLEPVLTVDDPLAKDKVHAKYLIEKGDISKGFADADMVVEGEYRTGFHEHAYIETQGMAAIPRPDGGLTVVGSLQCPYYVLKTLKSALNIHEDKVNVVQAPMGGAFGGKEDYPSLLGLYASFLSLKSGKPVKIVYARDEDIVVTTKRHPSVIKHRTGVKKDGTITAMEIDVVFDGGAYSTLSPVVLSRGLIHAAGPYKCANVRAEAHCYATNNVPTGAFRGFGAPQAFWALESHIDRVAESVGMSPYKFRFKNCVRLGDTLSTSQVLKESVAAEECLVAAAKASKFEDKWKRFSHLPISPSSHLPRKGIGISLYMHGGAFTGSAEAMMKTEAGLRLNKGGIVSVLTGCTDMGQGAHTVLPQIAADFLGLPMSMLDCAVPDTAIVPDSGPTVASRTTMIIGSVMRKCAATFRREFFEYVGAMKPDMRDGIIYDGKKKIGRFEHIADKFLKSKGGEYKVIERYQLPEGIKWDAEKHFGDAYPAYSWAADIAEVTVDMDTFEVTVDDLTMAVDIGKAVNPILLEGQIEGGTLQALGWGLMENCIYKNGRPVTDRFQNYIIPTVKDTPRWKVKLLEHPVSHGPFGAKGVGELPVDGGAPAIANAIYNAIGVRITELPMTAEKIFKAMINAK